MPQIAKRILIVDDDEAVRDTIAAVLGLAGYRCRTIANGIEALRLLKSGKRFHLVTADITNAPMDGIVFLEEMKDKFAEIPVLMITARCDALTESECRSKGACGYLHKPCTRQELVEAVHVAVGKVRNDRA